MPNWEVPGLDFVQGSWLKNFKSIEEGLRRNLQKCLENGNVSLTFNAPLIAELKRGRKIR